MASPKEDRRAHHRCATCHHYRKQHVPRCTDPMLGMGKWCDCEEFRGAPEPPTAEPEKEATPDASADPAPEEPRQVRRPAVRPRQS